MPTSTAPLLECLEPNEDGTMPSARLKACWTRLYEAGVFLRAWDDSRWAAIWRTLSDCGFLAVGGTDYWFDACGRGKGHAMEWRLDPRWSLAGGADTRTHTSLQEALPLYRPGLHRPNKVQPPSWPYQDAEAITELIFGCVPL